MLAGKIGRALHLTADQKIQLKAIRSQSAAAVEAIRADPSLTPDEKRSKVFETMTSARKQIHGVLTAEQEVRLHHIQRQLRKLRRLLAS